MERIWEEEEEEEEREGSGNRGETKSESGPLGSAAGIVRSHSSPGELC